MTRSTASRRARNSASVRIGGRRRPASRPSRRRWRLASSRVEPPMPWISLLLESGLFLARGARSCTTVLGGSSGRRAVLGVVAGTGLAPPAAAAALGGTVAGAVCRRRWRPSRRCRHRSRRPTRRRSRPTCPCRRRRSRSRRRLFATATSPSAASAATPSVGRAVGLLVVAVAVAVAVAIEVVVIVVVVVRIGAFGLLRGPGPLDRLRGDEQRHVFGPLGRGRSPASAATRARPTRQTPRLPTRPARRRSRGPARWPAGRERGPRRLARPWNARCGSARRAQ